MSGDEKDTTVPRGFRVEMRGKQLVIVCPHCKRRWRGDRIDRIENKEYLYSHLDDHRHTKNLTAWELGIPPDD